LTEITSSIEAVTQHWGETREVSAGLHLFEQDSDVKKEFASACVLFQISNNQITIETAEVVFKFMVTGSVTHTVIFNLGTVSKNEK
jgi:hypothetical protein